MFTPTTNSSRKLLGESVIFQPVLQTYPTHHSWIITAHISLGNLECHWKAFYRQLARTQQLLCSVDLQPYINSIQTRINQLITTQSSQQETLVHIISILNVTRYATQVNRHIINDLMDAARATSYDINNLYNITSSLTTSINFHQLILHISSVFANLCDTLNYI